MRRVLLITLSLVLALVGWSAVCAEDGFYVIPTMKGNYAPVPKTGQTEKYGTGDNGAFEKGVAWPTPRFSDNGNGTVTDKLTGLMWLKNANCIASHYPSFDNDGTPGDGAVTWVHALEFVAGITYGFYPLCGAGYSDWRLPNLRELQSLIDYVFYNPSLPNTLGTGKWTEGNPFQGVQWSNSTGATGYWSSTTYAGWTGGAFFVYFNDGIVSASQKINTFYVWPVRGGK